jgi:plasmid stability protein
MANLALRGLSEDVYSTLKRAAERNNRSLNGEILARLEASVRPAAAGAERVLARVEARDVGAGLVGLSDDLLRELKSTGRP